MHYSSHPPRAFRNRIAKSIGVIVAAAVVAALGLPSVAQAQSIARSGIVFTDSGDDAGFMITWTTRLDISGPDKVDNWIVTFTKPNGSTVVLNEQTENGTTGASLGSSMPTPVSLNQKDLGTWWVQVDACFEPLGTGDDKGVCPDGELESGTAVGYTHGAFPAPENLVASTVPTGVALTWTSEKSDYGFADYQYSMDEGKKWTVASADGAQVIPAKPGEYTFWVRARGNSDNDLNTPPTNPESLGLAASTETITVPTPTPTLPEIAALFLAMLLLGSGAYLLRRRQSGGLTPA